MMRAAGFLLVGTGFFALGVAYLVWLQVNGYESASMLALSGDAVLAAEGRTGVSAFATAYPPLPHLLSFLVAFTHLGTATPAAVAAALVGGIFAASLFGIIRQAGTAIGTSLFVVALLVANPLYLRALADGPDMALLLCAMLMLAHGLFGLTRDGTVQYAMAVAFALVLLAFSHHYGVLIVFAALPFLALSAPRTLVARAPGGLFLALLFPIAFTLLGFAYIGWLFAGAPWAFLSDPDATLVGSPDRTITIGYALLAALAIAVSSPQLPALIVRAVGRQILTIPALALGGTILVAVVLATASGSGLSTLLLLSPAVAIGSVCASRWPSPRYRGLAGVTLAAIGLLGGFMVAQRVDDDADRTWRQAALGKPSDQNHPLLAVATYLRDRKRVLVDAVSHPELVALRQTARGLVVPGDPRFELALLSIRPTEPLIAVPASTDPTVTQDRIRQAFSDFFDEGAPGYRVVYSDADWRIYEAQPSQTGEE